MNTKCLELAERIRGEVPDLDRVVRRCLASWEHVQVAPTEDAYLDSVALNLHSFYSGLERLLELIARHIDCTLPNGRTWHRDLLKQMAQPLADVRPAVIGKNTAKALDEFRRFRHLVRNVYTMNIVPEKVSRLIYRLPEVWEALRAELVSFADFLEDLAHVC